MEINRYQEIVDQWIKTVGVRYFDVKTNTLILAEEVGEFAKIVARTYGEQSFKTPTTEEEAREMLTDELADVFWVLTCLANQLDIRLEDALEKNLAKKNIRDKDRHKQNPKLNP